MGKKNAIDMQKTIDALKEKGTDRFVCPCCGGRDFGVHSDVATISVTDELNTLQLGSYVPAIMRLCNNCGNIQFFSAVKLGLIETKGGK